MIQKKRKGNTPIDKTYRYLNRVKSIDAMITKKQEQIDELRSIASSTALHTDSERVQSSRSKDKLGDCCAKIADLCTEINHDIDTFVDTKADVMHSIDLLENLEEHRVLYCRYFQYMEFFKISQEINVSENTVFRIHREAVKNLSVLLFPQSDEQIETW